MDLEKLGHMAEVDPGIDKEIDRRQVELSKTKGDFMFEGRLSGWLIDADLKIMLKTDVGVRARRIAGRENISPKQAMHETMVRQVSEAKRYRVHYDILSITTVISPKISSIPPVPLTVRNNPLSI